MTRIAAAILITFFLACSAKDRLLSSPYTDWQLDHGGIPRDALVKSLSLEEAISLLGPNVNSLGTLVFKGSHIPGDQLWQYRLIRTVSDSAHTIEVGIILVRNDKVIRRVILESSLVTRAGESRA